MLNACCRSDDDPRCSSAQSAWHWISLEQLTDQVCLRWQHIGWAGGRGTTSTFSAGSLLDKTLGANSTHQIAPSGVGVWRGVSTPQPTRGSAERRVLPTWLKKLCRHILCSVSVKCKLISIKNRYTCTGINAQRNCKKCPLHLKYVLALPWEIWRDRFNRQRSTHMHILINHRIATNTSGSHCL